MFRLTYRRPLSHPSGIRSLQELGLVVVDVLYFDDELGLGLDQLVGPSISSLSSKGVIRLLFPVQPLGGVNVSCILIDAEYGHRTFTTQDVPHLTITFIRVRVKLRDQRKPS